MTLDEAIRHAEEVAEKNEGEAEVYDLLAKNHNNPYEKLTASRFYTDCAECSADHRQLAEWLKELKAYKEQSGDAISRQAVLDLAKDLTFEGGCKHRCVDVLDIYSLPTMKKKRGERMNEAEKERLIKKDIESIENRVRHAFNQGYEMGMKESRSEIPNTCGDAISRNDVIDTLNNMHRYVADELTLCSTGKKFEGNEVFIVDDVYEEIAENLPSVNSQSIKCDDAISRAYIEPIIEELENICVNGDEHVLDLLADIKNAPSATPQQKTERWIPLEYDGYADGNPVWDKWECSKCGWEHSGDEESLTAFCPNCGVKMESEE